MRLLQAIRERLTPPPRREGVVIEYYAIDPNGRIDQRECIVQGVPGTLTVNCAHGWTQRLEFKEAKP
jgi:hypothetical protein